MQRILTIFILLSLTACLNVGPDYKRPNFSVPEHFKESQNDKFWKTAEPGDATLRGEWWSLYQDPYLNQLVKQALQNNQTLIAAEANYRQASALLKSYKSQQLPTANVNASDLRAQRSGTAVVAGGGRILNNYSLLFNANWELDIWGHIRRQVEAGEMSLLASQADFEVAKLSMLTTLIQSYFQLRIFDTQSVLYSQTIAAYQKAYEVTRNRYQVGVASKSDVSQALAQIKTTQALATDIKLQRAQIEHLIATLQGISPAEFNIALKPYNTEDPIVLPSVPLSLPSVLLERRPDIAAAERRVAAANANVGVAEAAFFPMITLSPFAGYQSTKYNTLYNTPSRVWSIGPNISLPIFDGGLRRAQKASAIANYDTTVATYRQAVLTGFQEVEDNLVALKDLNEEVNLQDEAVKASAEALEQYQNRYQAGTVDYLGVVTLQTTLLSNQGTANTLQGRRLIASVNLIKALGGSWDDKATLSQSE